MNVKELIKLTCKYLQLNNVLNLVALGGSVVSDEEAEKDLNLLITCVNLTHNLIASEYIKLFKTKTVETADGLINYNVFGSDKINYIYSVKDKYGNKVIYKEMNDYIKTISGYVEITYSYLPISVTLADSVMQYKSKINDRVFAYGVATEFCFIKGLYDEAAMWDSRFKNSLLVLANKKGELRLRKRRWL